MFERFTSKKCINGDYCYTLNFERITFLIESILQNQVSSNF